MSKQSPFLARSPLPRVTWLVLFGLAALRGGAVRGEAIDELVFSFGVPSAGPVGELVSTADQGFYGATSIGGAAGAGTLFKIGPDGKARTSIEFNAETGTQPAGGLTLGSDGQYYGVNVLGGADGLGTIFRVGSDGSVETVLAFTGAGEQNRGALPFASLLAANDGFLYGTTSRGGAHNFGTVFKCAEAGGPLTTLAEFSGTRGTAKGAHPYAGLVKATDGRFYGTTAFGGGPNHGTIFSIGADGAFTTLVEFTDQGAKNKGAAPYGGLTLGNDGNLYGTTARGGAGDYGTFFKFTPAGKLTTLLEFTGRAGKARGAQPEATLIAGPGGDFYGTTYNGGFYNVGTIFKVTPAGKLTSLVEFTVYGPKNAGAHPQAGLLLGGDGNFHGTTLSGGLANTGTAFQMTPAGVLTTQAAFAGIDPATHSQPGIIRASDGSFYGVSPDSGPRGLGSVFRLSSTGEIETLAEFSGYGAGTIGSKPRAPLLEAADGNFYGVTQQGGQFDLGTVFKITPQGELITLVEFTGDGATNKGAAPRAALIQLSDGDFYGVTTEGGAADAGTIFLMRPNGALTTLVEFTRNGAINRGATPEAPLLLGTDGNLHGTTSHGGVKGLGTVFTMTPHGVLTTLAEFTDDPFDVKGAIPVAGLVQASDGNYYGTTTTGGATGDGTIFRVAPDGVLTTLVELTGKAGARKGTGPAGALIQASDGGLYGITGYGGALNQGTAFRIGLGGAFTTVAELSYQHGAFPESGFILGSDGNLYSTAQLGGAFGAGSVFRLRMRAALDANEAAGITSTSAELRARMKSGGLAAVAYFEYGTSDFTQRTPGQALASSAPETILTAPLTGLLPDTTYRCRVVVVDSTGTVYGRDESFTTAPAATEVLATSGFIEGEPETTFVSSLGIPAIAGNQAVTLLAHLTTADGKDTAILAGTPPAIVAHLGTRAPVTGGGASAVFTAFKDPVCDATGRVAFGGTILFEGRQVQGLWTNLGGAVQEVARVGGDAPLVSGAKLTAIGSYAMSAAGVVFYTGTLAGSGIGPASRAAVWAFDADGHHLLIRTGDQLSSAKITSILTLSAVAGSAGQGRSFFGRALVARVTLSDRTQALVELTPGADPVVIGPTPFALAPTTAASVITSLGVPSVSTSGALAFWAQLQNEKPAIVAGLPATGLTVVAQTGTPAPGTDDARFATLRDPVLNAQGTTAFQATLSGTGVTPSNQRGLWLSNQAGLALIARTGDTTPGIPAAIWKDFVSLALPDSAGPVFLAKLAAGKISPGFPSDVNPTNNLALFAVDAGQGPRLLLRTGNVLQVHGRPKTLSLIAVLGAVPGSPGQGRAYNAARDLVFRATFTDRTEAIMRLPLP